MIEEQILEKLFSISKQQSEILDVLTSKKPVHHKDIWDRLTVIAPIVSALIIAGIGAYFTYTYNQQQLKLQEIQTIERFLPHLAGDERNKRAAILAISSLGDDKLAIKVASVFASEGTASALRTIARTSEPNDQQIVKEALYKTLDTLADRYKDENKYDDAIANYQKALETKEAILGKDNPSICEDLNNLATLYEQHGDHEAAEALLKRSAYIKKHLARDQASQEPLTKSPAADDTTTNTTDGSNQPSSDKPKPAKPTAEVKPVHDDVHNSRTDLQSSAGAQQFE